MLYSIELRGRQDAIWGYLYEAFVKINGITWVIVRGLSAETTWTRAVQRIITP